MSAEPSRFTFLQLSDVHLDSAGTATGYPLTIAQRKTREPEILRALLNAISIAGSRRVDAVLIPGDLWHNDTVRGDTITQVVEALGSLGDTPVLIAPGNRDFFGVNSPYNKEAQRIRGLPVWPPNVHIFTHEEFDMVVHPKRPDVVFAGRAFTSDKQTDARLLKTPILKPDSPLSILLFHGSLEGYSGADCDREGKMNAPFSLSDLKAQNFTYAALGHYHDLTEVRTDAGLMIGGYSGCLGGRSFDEIGPRYALLGTIEAGRPGRWNVSLEPIELDSRRLIMVALDTTGLSTDDMMEEAVLTIEEQGGRRTDIIYLHLEGRYSDKNEPSSVIEKLREKYRDLVLYDNTRPDFLAETYDQKTTEWKYIEALLELKRRIELARGTESDTSDMLSGTVVEDALYYGLDALRQRKVTVRNVD